MSKPTYEEDTLLFRNAVRDVTPLKQTKNIYHPSIKKAPSPAIIEIEEIPPNNNDFIPQEPSQFVQPNEKLHFSRHLPHKILRKLRQGQYNAEAKLDLHGYTVNKASYALSHFFHACIAANKHVVSIIHGKGEYAILKNQLNTWLREHPMVLAFCSAKPNQGGTGALTVLLKQQHKEPK